MNAYLIGHLNGEIRLVVPAGTKVQADIGLSLVEVHTDTMPDPSKQRYDKGALVAWERPVETVPKSNKPPLPTRAAFAEAQYQQFLGNDAPMTALRAQLTAATQKGTP